GIEDRAAPLEIRLMERDGQARAEQRRAAVLDPHGLPVSAEVDVAQADEPLDPGLVAEPGPKAHRRRFLFGDRDRDVDGVRLRAGARLRLHVREVLELEETPEAGIDLVDVEHVARLESELA